jgi:hypothetical protein
MLYKRKITIHLSRPYDSAEITSHNYFPPFTTLIEIKLVFLRINWVD